MTHTHNRRCTRGFSVRAKLEHFTPDRPTDGCWIWTGALSRGYGVIQIDGKLCKAHRVSFEEYVGPIPVGLTIDHVARLGCISKACINPDHLEPVTDAVNTRRARPDRCARHGRVFDRVRSRRSEGRAPSRYCSLCRSEYEKATR